MQDHMRDETEQLHNYVLVLAGDAEACGGDRGCTANEDRQRGASVELSGNEPGTNTSVQGSRFRALLDAATQVHTPSQILRTPSEFLAATERGELRDTRILIAAALDEYGCCPALDAMLCIVRRHDGAYEGSWAGILIDAQTELYSKAAARSLAYTLNASGCGLIGNPLVEGTGSLRNLEITAERQGRTLMEAYLMKAADLTDRLVRYAPPVYEHPRILCLHSSNVPTSNTLWLWEQIRSQFSDQVEIREVSLREGGIPDCAGCSYDACMYYSENAGCYYGGQIVTDLYPALQWCNAVVVLAPNYNDALGANLTASLNRMTSLYRRQPFYDRYVWGVVVSGYSGGDLVASQILDGFNMNKAFILPPRFAMTETAYRRGSMQPVPGIRNKAAAFAAHVERSMRGEYDGTS